MKPDTLILFGISMFLLGIAGFVIYTDYALLGIIGIIGLVLGFIFSIAGIVWAAVIAFLKRKNGSNKARGKSDKKDADML